MVGALSGFLKFNFPPARIFMGDSGSLPIGFTISVLCITLVNTADGTNAASLISDQSAALVVAIAILFIITVDSFRVFAARIMKGVSPFRGDRNHVHHYLLDTGLSQKQVVFTLTAAHIIVITLACLLQGYDPNLTVGIILLLCAAAFLLVVRKRKK
jgi:UDP-N-acetylmuramyl pentapeptide phosphotransferase/UDP-N-acetylglucosamine-1-phosphate transferase